VFLPKKTRKRRRKLVFLRERELNREKWIEREGLKGGEGEKIHRREECCVLGLFREERKTSLSDRFASYCHLFVDPTRTPPAPFLIFLTAI
jgi:hypothetical protein